MTTDNQKRYPNVPSKRVLIETKGRDNNSTATSHVDIYEPFVQHGKRVWVRAGGEQGQLDAIDATTAQISSNLHQSFVPFNGEL